MRTTLGLEDDLGQSVSLKSVRMEGKLEGLLLTMQVSQRYRNDTHDTIEATYTFPAGWGANLLGFSVTLNGKKMQAIALAKRQAEENYEKAIADGDTPVMLEKSPLGLYTANLGNLKPNEEAVIDIEYAQLLRFEKGRIRITVPTVIGSRYGDEEKDGHIASHQSLQVNALVEYPFTARLDILGDIASGNVTCPSHKADISQIEGGKRIELTKGGMLDRDFIVTIEDLSFASYAVTTQDNDGYAVIASFCPKLQEEKPSPLALKILVDCSGSMQGESMEQAQEALNDLLLQLQPKDMVSYSKFGTEVVHTAKQLEKCNPKYIKNTLAKAVYQTHADMGGTELNKALTSTFKLSFAKSYEEGCDLLLITDGDVWEIEETIRQAKVSNHRIFAIGVGSAPAESLLRDLAEKTGGACELITPHESISGGVLRMLQRMRSTRSTSVQIAWQEEVLWQSALPKQVFSEETVHVFAKLKAKPHTAPTLTWVAGKEEHTATAPGLTHQSTDTTARLVAGARILATTDEAEATELAIQYQLASKYTNLLLVHIRAEEEKADGLPKLEKIQQMQAAGWGGFGNVDLSRGSTVLYSRSMASFSYASPSRSAIVSNNLSAPSVWRTNKKQSISNVDQLAQGGVDDYEIPDFLKKQAGGGNDFGNIRFSPPIIFNEDDFSPDDMLRKFNELAVETNDFSHITFELLDPIVDGEVWTVLCNASGADGHVDHYWACLLDWLSKNVKGIVALNRHALRILQAELAKLDDPSQQKAQDLFAKSFTNITPNSWGLAKAQKKRTLLQRLKRIMA
jgi:Ca-activated chloride channel family protein